MTLTPAASSASGFSPAARRLSPTFVERKIQASSDDDHEAEVDDQRLVEQRVLAVDRLPTTGIRSSSGIGFVGVAPSRG